MAKQRQTYNLNRQTKLFDIHKQFMGGLKTIDTDDALRSVFLRDVNNLSLSEYGFLEKRYGTYINDEFSGIPFQENKPIQGYFEYVDDDGDVHKIMFYDGIAYIKNPKAENEEERNVYVAKDVFVTEPQFTYPSPQEISNETDFEVIEVEDPIGTFSGGAAGIFVFNETTSGRNDNILFDTIQFTELPQGRQDNILLEIIDFVETIDGFRSQANTAIFKFSEAIQGRKDNLLQSSLLFSETIQGRKDDSASVLITFTDNAEGRLDEDFASYIKFTANAAGRLDPIVNINLSFTDSVFGRDDAVPSSIMQFTDTAIGGIAASGVISNTLNFTENIIGFNSTQQTGQPNIIINGVTQTSVTFTLVNTDSDTSNIAYGLNTTNPTTAAPNIATSAQRTISGLSAGVGYTVNARATSISGLKLPSELRTTSFTTIGPTVTATFNSNGGTPTYNSVSGPAPLSVSSPGSPTRSGFTFAGWSPSLPRTISANTTFTAQWAAPKTATPSTTAVSSTTNSVTFGITNLDASSATITWQIVGPGGGAQASGSQSVSSQNGFQAIATGLSPSTTYSLISVVATASGKDPSNTATIRNLTTQAAPPPPTVTATFNSNGGSPTYSNQSGPAPLSVSNPGSPTRSGFTFLGWSPSVPTTINSNTTFTAQWQDDSPPPQCPAAGTVLDTFCIGVDLYEERADGNCGSTNVLVESNSTTCGYTPPVQPTTYTTTGQVQRGPSGGSWFLSLNITYRGSSRSISTSSATTLDSAIAGGTSVTVSAPSSVNYNGETYTFVNWRVNGADQSGGVTSITRTVNANTSFNPLYEPFGLGGF